MTPEIEAAAHHVPQVLTPGIATPIITPVQRYRRSWAGHILASTGDVPRYGSEAWARLEADDPRKQAAAVAAAEGAAREEDDLAFHLAVEDYERRRENDRYWQRQYARRKDMVVGALEAMTVNERRAQPRQVGGYQGGPVSWEPQEGAA